MCTFDDHRCGKAVLTGTIAGQARIVAGMGRTDRPKDQRRAQVTHLVPVNVERGRIQRQRVFEPFDADGRVSRQNGAGGDDTHALRQRVRKSERADVRFL